MKKIVLCLLLLFNTFESNAKNKVTIGASFAYGTKFSLEQHLGFSSYEPDLYIRVNGQSENSLGFIGQLGVHFDPLRYSVGSHNRFSIIQVNYSFTGLINFPAKDEHLNFVAGFGIEYGNKPIIGYSTTGSSLSELTINTDSTEQLVDLYRRRIIPSVSLGLYYRPLRNRKVSAFFIIKQNLLQLFTEDIEIPYQMGGYYSSVVINYKPTYLKLGLSYDIW